MNSRTFIGSASASPELEAALQRTFPSDAVEMLKLFLGRLRSRPTSKWNVRNARDNFSSLCDQAYEGVPQFVQRQGDDLPLLMISLESFSEALQESGLAGRLFLSFLNAGTEVVEGERITPRQSPPRKHPLLSALATEQRCTEQTLARS